MRKFLRPTDWALLAAVLVFIAARQVILMVDSKRMDRAADMALADLTAFGAIRDVVRLVTEAETGQRLYILTGKPDFLVPYEEAKKSVFPVVRELEKRNSKDYFTTLKTELARLIVLNFSEMEKIIAQCRLEQCSWGGSMFTAYKGAQNLRRIQDLSEKLSYEIHERGQNESARVRALSARANQISLIVAVALLLLVPATIVLRNEAFQRLSDAFQRAGQLLDALHDEKDRYQALARRHVAVREEERGRLAREIHDSLGQSVTALKLDLHSLSARLDPGDEESRSIVQQASVVADEALQRLQTIATELRPPILDHLGLLAAIDWQAQEFAKRTGAVYTIDLPKEPVSLSGDEQTAAFRICQEALTNVARHANATEVRITARVERDFHLEIRDNGAGFDQSARVSSLGLLGMKERAELISAHLEIQSRRGAGTAVLLRLQVCSGL